MGFLDKARAAANDLALKADTALASSGIGTPGASGGGDANKYFRDLGVLAYLEATGRPAGPSERQRVMTALQELESRGAVRSFALHTAPPPPPGAAGAGVAGGFPPPPGTAGSSAPPAPDVAQVTPVDRPAAPPPPPPSWLTKDGNG